MKKINYQSLNFKNIYKIKAFSTNKKFYENKKTKEKRYENYKEIMKLGKETNQMRMGYFGSLMSALHLIDQGNDNIEFSFEGLNEQRFVDNSILDIIPGSYGEYNNPQLGDPWKESSTMHTVNDQEREIFDILGDYLGIGGHNLKGYVTSGGTEGNLASLWWSKRYLNFLNKEKYDQINNTDIDFYKKTVILNEITNPIVYFTKTHTHYSLYKICDVLNLQFKEVEPLDSGHMDVNDFENQIKEHTNKHPHRSIIVSANVGTTKFGAIDNIPEINKILKNVCYPKDIKYTIHADGAYLGICLPILKPFGHIKNYFDELGIHTLTISGHKIMGLSVCGIAIIKKDILDKAFDGTKEIDYCGYIKDNTLSGCRPGLTVLLIHNTLHSLFPERDYSFFNLIIKKNLENANYAYHKLCDLYGEDNVFMNPNQFNIIFKRPNQQIIKKYSIMLVDTDKCCITILQHVNKNKIDMLIYDLKKEVKE